MHVRLQLGQGVAGGRSSPPPPQARSTPPAGLPHFFVSLNASSAPAVAPDLLVRKFNHRERVARPTGSSSRCSSSRSNLFFPPACPRPLRARPSLNAVHGLTRQRPPPRAAVNTRSPRPHRALSPPWPAALHGHASVLPPSIQGSSTRTAAINPGPFGAASVGGGDLATTGRTRRPKAAVDFRAHLRPTRHNLPAQHSAPRQRPAPPARNG